MRTPPPRDQVLRLLAERLGPSHPPAPRHYVRFGDVLLLDVAEPQAPDAGRVAQAYAEVLGCRSVVAWEGGIEGELRQPRAHLLWGDPNTETVHVEDGIRYRFDPARIMWSPGNQPERRRVASWDCRGETVVDLFAGIGYFALPLAVRAGAARVLAIEKNPPSHAFLVANAELNGVSDRIEAVCADNRNVPARSAADRVLLGYLHEAREFLPVAVRHLKRSGGWLHVHVKDPIERFPQATAATIGERLQAFGWRVAGWTGHEVKSYAPRVVHGVIDLEVRPSGS